MSFSIMCNMLEVELGKFKQVYRELKIGGFEIEPLQLEVMIVTTKVIVHNERVFLLLHSAHSSTCSLQE